MTGDMPSFAMPLLCMVMAVMLLADSLLLWHSVRPCRRVRQRAGRSWAVRAPDGFIRYAFVAEDPFFRIDGVAVKTCVSGVVAVRYRITDTDRLVCADVWPSYFTAIQHGGRLAEVRLDGLTPEMSCHGLRPGGSVTLVQVFRAADRSPLLVVPADGGAEGFTVPWTNASEEASDGC